MASATARVALLSVAAGLTASACGPPAGNSSNADDFPERTVTVVVPYAAGGSLDTNARILTDCLNEKESGGEWIIQNQDGGGGAIGTGNVANAENDGYTLGYIASTTATLGPLLSDDAQYETSDLRPLVAVTNSPGVLVVGENSPYDDAEDFLDSDEKRTIATSSAIGVYQLLADELSSNTNIEGVPFDGAAPAVTAALGGNADAALIEIFSSTEEQIESGKLKAIAVAADEPAPQLPDTPTLQSLGYEHSPAENHGVLVGPSDLPDDVAGKITELASDCTQQDDVIEEVGEDYIFDPPLTGDDVTELIQAAAESYSEAVGDGT